MTTPLEIETVLDLVRAEVARAKEKRPCEFATAHEGYAVILEELDEAWDAIKGNAFAHARVEMVQVAAMAVKFIAEFVNGWR